jgi:hypothetical protein
MNIDTDLVNRALFTIGDDPLQPGDKSEENMRYKAIKAYYLQSFLESVSEVPWQMAKRRAVLVKSTATNNSPYLFLYTLPIDCARPLEITGCEFFVIEGGILLTNRDGVKLLYVTNGKVSTAVTGHDFPNYTLPTPDYEPKFYSYFETKLAAKLAVKITNKYELRMALQQEAAMIKQEAVLAAMAFSNTKDQGERRWNEEYQIAAQMNLAAQESRART